MGLNSPALKYIISRSKKYDFNGPVITFGNQDIYASFESLVKWAKQSHINIPKNINIKLSTSQDLKNINYESKKFVHAKTFFNILGITDQNYYDVDKYDFDKPKILHDLELPFSKKYKNYFNLVIDSGTLEHIFDIKSVMSNTINITKVGGYIVQIIPTNNFINHGFYQINPTFFHDFYTINGFKVMESHIIEFRATGYRFHNYQQKKFTTFFVNPYSRLATIFIVKKTKSVKNIKTPTQYTYQQVIKHKLTKFDRYTNIARKYLPFRIHSYFYQFWVIYKQLTSPKKYFDIPYK